MFLLVRLLALAVLLLAATGAAAQNAPEAIITGDAEQTFDCAPPAGAQVPLDGSDSSDPDDDVLSFRWTEGTTELSVEAAPTVLLTPGEHLIRLTVSDEDGEDFAEVTITVVADTTPPVLELSDESDELWPPNHKRRPFTAASLVETVSDECSELTPDDVVFVNGTSDESDDGEGDGNARDDVVFTDDCGEASVRAERAGTGDGRAYVLSLMVEDEAENSAHADFRVFVPHDQADDAVEGDAVAHYVSPCGDALASCEPIPDPECTLADTGAVTLRDGKKGPSLRWYAAGFPAQSVSDEGSLLCLYVDEVLAGGSADADKVRIKNKAGAGSLKLATKGADLELPGLPLEGADLRLELHDGVDACVASSFDDPLVNEAGRYQAATD